MALAAKNNIYRLSLYNYLQEKRSQELGAGPKMRKMPTHVPAPFLVLLIGIGDLFRRARSETRARVFLSLSRIKRVVACRAQRLISR